MKDGEPLLLNSLDPEAGGYEESITNDFAYKNNVANAEVNIRLKFIRKVYSLLCIQLGLTVILSSLGLFSTTIQFYITHNDWLVIVAFVATFVFLFALFAYRRNHPHNLFLLAGFTIAESYTIGIVITRYDTITVLQAVFLTFIVVMGLTLYTFQTKKDFTSMGAGLTAGLLVLIVGGLLQLFIGGTALELLLSCGGAFLFSLFIIYDTQMLMRKLSPEEYILATISLYLDIINLFMYILRILAEAKRQ